MYNIYYMYLNCLYELYTIYLKKFLIIFEVPVNLLKKYKNIFLINRKFYQKKSKQWAALNYENFFKTLC